MEIQHGKDCMCQIVIEVPTELLPDGMQEKICETNQDFHFILKSICLALILMSGATL